jgi:hypothetical protein
MYVFEITIPGTWLEAEDRNWAWKIQQLLSHLESEFYEANLALNLFISSVEKRRVSSHSRAQWEADANRRYEIRQQLEEKYNSRFRPELWDQVSFESEVLFKREQWQQGRIPREYEHNEPFIYARAFLYALDAFDKLLGVLSREDGVPEAIAQLHAKTGMEFPDLRGVRNTAQHLEDRARGLGAGRNPLELQPIQNRMVNAPNGGVLMLNCLNGTRYGSTMADGRYGEVDVSPDSMGKLRSILQQTLDSFQWRGPKRHCPNI